jgi:enediyne polyketide synthase
MADAAPARRTAAAQPIAVVGLACRFPDADDPAALLDSTLTGRRAFRRLPPVRLSLDDYHRPDPATSDATYANRAALLQGWRFDCAAFGVEPAVYAASDPAHWLALETAARALAAAGLPAGVGLNRDRTGVIMGNTLAGQLSRANALRSRWPYVRRTLARALDATDIPASQAEQVLIRAERGYLAPFPAMGPYSLAGSMPATIAGTISAYFGFRGGSHAVDSACSSSLQAVASACLALAAGDLDAAVVGGVDLSLDPFQLIGLSRARMLATTDVRLYDQSPSGFLPGEGCGVLVLMRTADARAADLQVCAEIVGWGTSSGGLPGQPQSQASSELLAMRRAYDRAGADPADIDYIEGNGAATLAADAAELAALASLRHGSRRTAALGSVKANIGHAGAAAGAAGLIKTVLAVNAGVVPPTTGTDRPHELITGGDARVTLPAAPREWGAGRRLAAVSATGIGGSNVHVVVRHEPTGRSRAARWQQPGGLEPEVEPKLARVAEPLPFLLHAPDRHALAAALTRLADRARWLSDAEMLDLACTLGRDPARQGPARAALVATRQEQLAALAGRAVAMLPDLADGLLAAGAGIFTSDNADGRVTLLLSGDERSGPADPAAKSVIGEVGHCLTMLRWLDSLDVAATGAVGHGIGLLAGLAWAGVLGGREVTEIAELRAQFLVSVAPGAGQGAWPPPDDSDASALRRAIAQRFRFGPPRRRLISTVTGTEVGTVDDAIDLICRGFAGSNAVATAVAAGAVGATLLLDTGPGQALTRAAANGRVPTLSLRSGLVDSVNSATVAAALFAAGAVGDPQPLFAGWQSRPFDIGREQVFLASPCEEPMPRSAEARSAADRQRPRPIQPRPAPSQLARPQPAEARPPRSAGLTSQPGRAPVAGRAEPPDAEITSPIAAADHVTRAAVPVGATGPGGQLAGQAGVPASHRTGFVPGVTPWARCFTEGLRPAPPPADPLPNCSWRVFAAASNPRLADLGSHFSADPSAGRTLAVIEDPADERSRTAALTAARDSVSTGELVVLTTSSGFTGFFATLHAEHPSVGVTVLRVSPDAASPAAIMPFATAAPGQFRELVIGPDGTASVPVLTRVPLQSGAGFPLGQQDVIIVTRSTGGAGLALARVLACSGAGIIVVGRAGAAGDSGLIAGLEELRSAGARIGYEVIDITDEPSLASAISRIERRLGPVTAIVHAARPDEPVPIIDLTDADVTGHPDAQSAPLERLAASAGGQLKLIISVGSLAGRYGLAGAGLHALGRGTLASRAAEIAAATSGCRALHIDVPPWSDGDVGEQRELAGRLAAAETPSMRLLDASRLLLKIMTTDGLPQSLAVHGRVDGLASIRPPIVTGDELAAAGLPRGGRFLREVAVHYPGTELVCSARLSLAADPYLADYRIDGMLVLPPVLAVEALAQVASVLAGRAVRQASSLRLDAPVLIPDDGEATLRVCALRDGDSIGTALRSSGTSYRVDHATAVFSCAPPPLPDSAVAAAPSAVPPLVSATGTGLVDGAELYGSVCFQSGRFRRIALLPEVTPRSGRAIARGSEELPWFAPGSDLNATGFLLGSPGLNDAALQVLQACVPYRRVRPTGCDSVQFSGREATGPVEIRAIAEPRRRAGSLPDQPGPPAAEQDEDGPLAGTSALGSERGADPAARHNGDLLAAAPAPARRARHARTTRTPRGLTIAGRDLVSVPPSRSPGPAVPAGADAVTRDGQLWSVEAVDASGQLLAVWRGIRIADAGPLPRSSPWPPALLSVFLERCATELGLEAGLRVTVSCGQPDVALTAIPRQAGPAGSGQVARKAPVAGLLAAGERRGLNAVTSRGTGQLAGFTLTARAPTPVGCGWVTVEQASRPYQPAGDLAVSYGQLHAELGEQPAVLAGRLEAVRACLASAGLRADADLRVARTTSDGWAVLATRRARIASTVVEISGVAAPVAIAVLTLRRAHARTAPSRAPVAVTP